MHGSLQKEGSDLKKVMDLKESYLGPSSWLAFSKWYFQVPKIYLLSKEEHRQHPDTRNARLARWLVPRIPPPRRLRQRDQCRFEQQQIKNQHQDWESLRGRHH